MRALEFFGGCTALWVPDNLHSGATRASRYEPDLNPTYHDLAEHYGVPVITRWVLARLRQQRFFSLNEPNRALRILLHDLNKRPFKKLPGCRASAFAEMDQAVLRPLPQRHYEYAEWKVARASVDYHVEIDGHYYLVTCVCARPGRRAHARGAPRSRRLERRHTGREGRDHRTALRGAG